MRLCTILLLPFLLLLLEATHNTSSEIKMIGLKALRRVDTIPWENWTQMYDQGRWWDNMITNFVESITFALKDTHNLPIITFGNESTYYRLRDLFLQLTVANKVSHTNPIYGVVGSRNLLTTVKIQINHV